MTRPSATPNSALVALLLLGACSTDAGGPEPPEAGATPPTSTPAGWTPLTESADELLVAGTRYGLDVNGVPDAPWAVVTVPEGFSNLFGWALFDERVEGDVGLGYWTVSEVALRPCGGAAGNEPVDAGDTVQDLVDTLTRQELTRMTKPQRVILGGHRGVRMDMQVPRDLDVADCLGQQYLLWESDPEGARHIEEPGRLDRLWILDVDGEVVVLQVTSGPDVPQRDLRRVNGVLESVEFVDRTQ
jgi:hypothetical protein